MLAYVPDGTAVTLQLSKAGYIQQCAAPTVELHADATLDLRLVARANISADPSVVAPVDRAPRFVSGVVFESTPTGRQLIPGAFVDFEPLSDFPAATTTTDAKRQVFPLRNLQRAVRVLWGVGRTQSRRVRSVDRKRRRGNRAAVVASFAKLRSLSMQRPSLIRSYAKRRRRRVPVLHSVASMRSALFIAFLGVVGCAGTSEAPTPVPTSADSRAALLAGAYALTITLDERCSQIAIPKWTYRATLADAGGYLNVNVVGGGYTELTGVGQAYTFPDFSARFVWNLDDRILSIQIREPPGRNYCSTARVTPRS